VPGNPESHLERTLNEPDNLESSEILFLQADSLAVALRGLAATNEPTISTGEYDERQAAVAVIVTDAKIFYAEFHGVPQDSPQDLPHGTAGPRQLYVGSTRSELAFSVHQLSMSFLNGGSWELGYKPRL
jgi:hypothetical protein